MDILWPKCQSMTRESWFSRTFSWDCVLLSKCLQRTRGRKSGIAGDPRLALHILSQHPPFTHIERQFQLSFGSPSGHIKHADHYSPYKKNQHYISPLSSHTSSCSPFLLLFLFPSQAPPSLYLLWLFVLFPLLSMTEAVTLWSSFFLSFTWSVSCIIDIPSFLPNIHLSVHTTCVLLWFGYLTQDDIFKFHPFA